MPQNTFHLAMVAEKIDLMDIPLYCQLLFLL